MGLDDSEEEKLKLVEGYLEEENLLNCCAWGVDDVCGGAVRSSVIVG